MHAFFSSMLQTKTFNITRKQQNNAAESFQETVSLFVSCCIEKFTSERKVAFRSLLVQVETGQMSAVETGQMTAAETSVLSQQKKAQVQSWLTKVPVPSKDIKFGLKWVENRRFGPKQRPNESYGLSGPIRTTPEAKNGKKTDFLRKTAPGGRPAAPSDPVS